MMFLSTYISNIIPTDAYYHDNDVLMFLWSISTPFALIVSWLLCSTETNNYVYFVRRRRRLTAFPSVPDGQVVVYNHIRVEGAGWLPLGMVYRPSLLHSTADIKYYIYKICRHQVTDVPDDVIGRRCGYQDTDASLWIYSIDCCVVVPS